MPVVINYSTVLKTLEQSGLRCVYPNGGAFGLPPDVGSHFVGWCGSDDPTIRAEMRAVARIVPPPVSKSLAGILVRAWQQHLPGPLWLMPGSHWTYELQFGSPDWLPRLLEENGIEAAVLQTRSDGSAIQFQPEEADLVRGMLEAVFDRLNASDFTVAFPNRPVVALLHHHRQVWWQTSDERIWKALSAIF